MMRPTMRLATCLALLLVQSSWSATAPSADRFEADRRAIEDVERSLVAADTIDRIMKFYAPGEDTVVYDPVMPDPVRGFQAIKNAFLQELSGLTSLSASVLELTVESDGKLGYAFSVQRVSVQKKNGAREQHVLRQTDVLRKLQGRWLIVHEHFSYTK